MKRWWPLLRQIVGILAGTFLLGVYPLAVYGDREIIMAVLAGAALGTLNVLLGFAAIEYAFDKSMTAFTSTLIGGMGIRLLVLLGALALLIAAAGVHVAALTISLFYFYTVYLVVEILYIQKKVQTSSDAGTGS